MNEAEKQKVISELKDFYKELRSYKNRQLRRRKTTFSEAQNRSLDYLRLKLQRNQGRLANIILKYAGQANIVILGKSYDVFGYSLSSLHMQSDELEALDGAILAVNKTIGRLESVTLADTGLQDVSVAQPPKDNSETPSSLFDRMQFHPRVIEVSESLFKTGNYSSAIFEAFKAVHNYVQDKTGLTLDGVNLMEKVFNENKPILQLNELLTKSDRDEQKGFKYLFMGSQMGIRNPQAHENVKPEEQNIALEYLGIASLLMR